jgi:hypothetical protein
MIIFMEEEDLLKLIEVGKLGGWKMYNSEALGQIVTQTEGLLLLLPSQCRGLNTPFKITSDVLIGCEIEDESEHVQMTGRSCRTRGICHSSYYFDKHADEAAVRISWKRNAFTKS